MEDLKPNLQKLLAPLVYPGSVFSYYGKKSAISKGICRKFHPLCQRSRAATSPEGRGFAAAATYTAQQLPPRGSWRAKRD